MRSNKTGRGTHFMNIREMREAWEADYLSPYASLSRNTKGRVELLGKGIEAYKAKGGK